MLKITKIIENYLKNIYQIVKYTFPLLAKV